MQITLQSVQITRNSVGVMTNSAELTKLQKQRCRGLQIIYELAQVIANYS